MRPVHDWATAAAAAPTVAGWSRRLDRGVAAVSGAIATGTAAACDGSLANGGSLFYAKRLECVFRRRSKRATRVPGRPPLVGRRGALGEPFGAFAPLRR